MTKVIRRQRVMLCRLRKQQLTSKPATRTSFARWRTTNRVVSADDNMLRHPFIKFVTSQLKLFKRNNKGRRYTTYDKNFALSLFYASPKAYRFCSKLFCLPSVTMLRLWLRRLHVKPGFCDTVFDMLKQSQLA